MIEIVALHARISESSPHDLHGVEALSEELPRRLDAPASESICGREGPFGHTPMSLAGACGAWDSGLGSMSAGRVVHYGARIESGDFDEAGHREAEASELTMIPIDATGPERVLAALDGAPVHVHLDPDVLDSSVFPVPCCRRGGLSAEALRELVGAVADSSPMVGLEITAYYAPEDRPGPT